MALHMKAADDSKPAEGKVAEGQNIITFVYKAEPKTGSVIVTTRSKVVKTSKTQ